MNREEGEKHIEDAMSHVHPRRLEPHAIKSKRLVFRMHDEEFEEIRATAEALDMSVSEYFCALHRYAVKRLQIQQNEAEWVHRKPRDGWTPLDE